MKGDKNIEEIFRSTLEGHESPVDPGLWQGISQSISTGVASGSASAGTSLLGKLGLFKVAGIVLGTLGVGAIALTVLDNDEPVVSEPTEIAENVETVEEQVSTDPTVESSLAESQKGTTSEIEENNDAFIAAELESEIEPIESVENHSDSHSSSEDTPPLADENSVTSNEEILPVESEAIIEDQNQAEKDSPAEEDIIYAELRPSFTIEKTRSDKLVYQFNAAVNKDTEYQWDFGDGNYSVGRSVVHEFEVAGDYSVQLTLVRNEEITSRIMEVKAYMDPVLIIPDIFTPNSDFLNQNFDPMAQSENVTIEKIMIYDSNNQLVFNGDGENYLWNGQKPDGSGCDEGTYLYAIQFIGDNGEIINKAGTVYLKR